MPKNSEASPKNLETAIDIAADPERVWAVVSDLGRMPEFSPQCIRMQVLGKPRLGSFVVNLNRDGWKFWPTTARIIRYEPGTSVAFRINENRMVWSFTIEPTEGGSRLIQRRDASNGTTQLSRTAIKVALGGQTAFEESMLRGMNETLAKIKTAVEQG